MDSQIILSRQRTEEAAAAIAAFQSATLQLYLTLLTDSASILTGETMLKLKQCMQAEAAFFAALEPLSVAG